MKKKTLIQYQLITFANIKTHNFLLQNKSEEFDRLHCNVVLFVQSH